MLALLPAAPAYRFDLDSHGVTFEGYRAPQTCVVTLRDGRRIPATVTDGGTADLPGGLQVGLKVVRKPAYVREQFTLRATTADVDVARFDVVDGTLAGAKVSGTVQGSPVVTDRLFLALEHPMSDSTAEGSHVRCGIERKIPLHPGSAVVYSAVFGVARPGELRRDFLAYLEAERPRRYKPFLHYNSWYDIGYFTPYTADQAVDRIQAFGEALTRRRGVALSSFLFDDGWDDTSTVWEFNKGFPQGFAPLRDAAARYGAAPGMWLSPWGGYGGPHTARVATAHRLGYEVGPEGYALSGPKYYARFHEATLGFVRQFGVNQFKFDGTGSPDVQYPGSAYASDFDAAIALITDLRSAQPSLFVNLTTGTWPSPFWTRYADSIWRGGGDHSFAGVGPDRERWITYRDGDTYRGIVSQGPLYPLNSLMLHGLIYAQHANKLMTDPTHAWIHEVHSYFGTGTQLQEMYVTPGLLSSDDWDTLAEAARWSQANAQTLVDTHWIGGDPRELQVYGWAAWSPVSAIVTLRNPSDQPQTFSLDIAKALEVPAEKARVTLRSPWKSDAKVQSLPLDGPATITLAPFEVLTLQGKVPG